MCVLVAVRVCVMGLWPAETTAFLLCIGLLFVSALDHRLASLQVQYLCISSCQLPKQL
jgi:hypothetical protein